MKLLYYNSNSAAVIFPSIFFSKEGLSGTLDIIGALHLESSIEYSSASPIINLPHIKLSVHLPCSRIIIREIYKFIETFVSETLLKALCQAPKCVLSAFAFYVYSSNKIIKNSPNTKTSGITNFGISVLHHHYYSSRIFSSNKFHMLESYLYPEKFHAWYKQQKPSKTYFIRDENTLQLQGTYLSMGDSLLESKVSINTALLELRECIIKDTEIDTHNSEIFDILGKITAMMIITGQNLCFSEIVRVPISNSSAISVTAAVFCWEWLASSIPLIKSSLFLELYSFWIQYLSTQEFLLQQKPLSRPLTLMQYNSHKGKNIAKKLENLLLVVEFIQRQVYSSATDINAEKYLIKLLYQTVKQKMNPEIMNYVAGVEIVLRLLITILDICKYFHEDNSNDIGLKFIDFFLSGFLYKHLWIKCLSVDKYNIITELFENCLEELNNFKVTEEDVKIEQKCNLEDPHTWIGRSENDIYYAKNVAFKGNETKIAYKKDILIVFLYHQYQKLIAWNSAGSPMISW